MLEDCPPETLGRTYAQYMDEMTWSLGAVRTINRKRREFKLDSVRELTEEEFNRFASDVNLLRSLGGHHLIAALVDKLNAVVQIEVKLHENPHLIQDERFRYRGVSVVDAFLGELTAFRSRIQALVDHHLPDYSGRIRGVFGQFHDDNAQYRLAWELRNSSQHGVGATRHFQMAASDDGPRWTVGLAALFADHRGERRWEVAAALWRSTELVNVMVVFHGAYEASSQALAVLLVENEPAILTVIDRFAQAIAEGVGTEPGFPAAWSIVSIDETTINFNQFGFEPVVLGDAISSLQGARKILGLPASERFRADPG